MEAGRSARYSADATLVPRTSVGPRRADATPALKDDDGYPSCHPATAHRGPRPPCLVVGRDGIPSGPSLLAGLRLPHDGHVPHHRLPHGGGHGAAHDPGRPRRSKAHVLGPDRLHDRSDHLHARHRQVGRPAGPQADPHRRHRGVPHRFGPVRAGAEHARLRSDALCPGTGRRSAPGLRPGHHWRFHSPARARSLPGVS